MEQKLTRKHPHGVERNAEISMLYVFSELKVLRISHILGVFYLLNNRLGSNYASFLKDESVQFNMLIRLYYDICLCSEFC